MQTVNTTEVLQSAEEIREEKQEVQTITNRRALHPVLRAWLAGAASKFVEISPKGGDLVSKPEQHPHVQYIRRSFPQMSVETATKMAWLVWRAGQVQFWSRNLDRDTYAKDGNLTVLVHRGVDTMTWEQALEHADARDTFHDVAMERRARYYAAQDARREEEESIALIIGAQPGEQAEKAAEVAKIHTPEEIALRNANAQADAKLEAKTKAQAENLRKIEAVKPKVRKTGGKNQNQK